MTISREREELGPWLWHLIAREHELSIVGTAPDGLVERLMAVGATA
jgi:hypothetical protein